jgi:hypothetical protein
MLITPLNVTGYLEDVDEKWQEYLRGEGAEVDEDEDDKDEDENLELFTDDERFASSQYDPLRGALGYYKGKPAPSAAPEVEKARSLHQNNERHQSKRRFA